MRANSSKQRCPALCINVFCVFFSHKKNSNFEILNQTVFRGDFLLYYKFRIFQNNDLTVEDQARQNIFENLLLQAIRNGS